MSYTLRRCGPKDAARLALIAQAAFLEAFAGQLDGADILEHCRRKNSEAYYRAWLAEPRAALWLAEVAPGAAPIGFAGLATPDLPLDTGAEDIELKRIYVLHRFHGGGAGQGLMSAALDHARDSGVARVLIGVKADNHRAIAFYKKNGFEIIGTRRFQVGANLYDDVVLARALA
jgi:ribosomal protein S18 acetylase RimI-like enzyme